jgi:HD-GYP domain-containing protein (c-di-GMP phosphodiesterase class II)
MEKSPALHLLIPMVRHHHEFFNGKGYPDRLMGNQIPIEARIVALADAIEAMTSERPYSKAAGTSAIVNEIQAYAGTQFDPLVVEAAVQMIAAESQPGTPDPEIQPGLLRTFVPTS